MKRNEKKIIHRIGDPDPRHPGRKLLTRRDFLSSGALSFSGALFLPSVLDLVLMEQARADGCPSGGALPGMMPFIIFDCAGGASLPGNWVIGGTEARPAGATFAADASLISVPSPPANKTAAQVAAETAFSNPFVPLTDPSIGGGYDALGLIAAPGNTSKTAAGTEGYNADFRFGAPMAASNDLSPNGAGLGTNNGNITNNNNIQSQIFAAICAVVPDGTNGYTLSSTPPAAPTYTPPVLTGGVANYQQYLRMGVLCHPSLSDSGTNQLSAVSMVTSAGALGNRIQNGLGMRQGNSAGNSDVANLNGAYRPMGINDVSSLTTALSYGPAFANLSTTVKQAVGNALVSLTGTQASNFAAMNLGQQLATLTQCGHIKNLSYTGNAPALDAAADWTKITDPVLANQVKQTQVAFPNAVATPGNSGSGPGSDQLVATLVMAALIGASGPAVITIGGCDYHTNVRTDGDTTDNIIGTRIGQAVLLAGLLNIPFAFQVLTDGGIASAPSTRNWAGDDNNHSLSIFGVFDPSGPHDMVSTQINTYTAGQSANLTHFISSDPSLVASAVFLNYLAVCGKSSQFGALVNSTTNFPPSVLNALYLFKDKNS